MGLATPQSAILSAVIFNALIIVALIPLALRGVRYRPVERGDAAAPQPADLRPRRRGHAVRRDLPHRPARPTHPGDLRHAHSLATDRRRAARAARVHGALRHRLPARRSGPSPASRACAANAEGSVVTRRRHAPSARPDRGRPGGRGPGRRPVLPHPALGGRAPRGRHVLGPADTSTSGGSNKGAFDPDLLATIEQRRPDRRPRGRRPGAGAARRGHRVGLRPGPGHQPGLRGAAGRAGGPGDRPVRRPGAGARRGPPRPRPRLPRRAGRERADAEPGRPAALR